MSDKGLGDNLNRNIVKNPLLSTAVTGLSIEDLTHNAVLLPAAPTQGLTTSHDQQHRSQIVTLAHTDRKQENFPSGDANLKIINTNHPPTNLPVVQHTPKSDSNPKTIVSKALPKSDDDFDVNEYFARLQGTRYVSAPLNSLMKDDKQTSLEATEENLEEINLNEPEKSVEVQQSLTADIAQNFSQLPTVLPQMASAVFSSFSSMLHKKSREQTPDVPSDKPSEYQDVQFSRPEDVGVPLMGVEEPNVLKEVAPPPRELPIGGTSNYRITTRKKAYAQIPGLSSTNTAPNNPSMDPAPYNFTIDTNNTFQPSLANVTDISKSTEPNLLEIHSQVNVGFVRTEIENSQINFGQATSNIPYQKEYHLFTSTVPDNNQLVNTESTQKEYNIFTPSEMNTAKVETNFFTTVEQNLEQQTQATNAAIIPPPPMFSNVPKDSQASVKPVLPPSVARRIGSKHPIIKPQTLPPTLVSQEIFVPAPVTDTAPTATSLESKDITAPAIKNDISPAPIASAFVQFNTPTAAERIVTQTGSIPTGYPPLQVPMSTNPVNIPPATSTMPQLLKQESSQSNLANQTTTSANTFPPASKPQSQTVAPPPLFFNPTNMSVPTLPPLGPASQTFSPEEVAPTNIPSMPPSTFFNPIFAQILETKDTPQYNMPQSFDQTTPETSKPVTEPPKFSGSLNYRMQKKRPQYYSGPIEGVGTISNNVKPTISTVEPSTFQGSLFTPQTIEPVKEKPVLNINPAIIPEQTFTTLFTQFDLNSTTPQVHNNTVSDYNTAFDMSRETTDAYEPPKEESKGFGIIGSLKSKLSSLDINKIQNTVTTFFDPAYNDSKKEQPSTQSHYNDNNLSFGYNRNDSSSLDVFVPSLDQNIRSYNQSYGQYTQQPPYNYGQTNQYYPNQSFDYNQVQHNTSPSYYTGYNQPAQNYEPYSGNVYEPSSFNNPQITQTETITQMPIQKPETESVISSNLSQESDEIITEIGKHGAIGEIGRFDKALNKDVLSGTAEISYTAPSAVGERKHEIASLFQFENMDGNSLKDAKPVGLIGQKDTAAFFDNQPFDLSSIHAEDLNKRLESLQIAQEEEADIILKSNILPKDVALEIFSDKLHTLKPYQQNTVTGKFFTNFPTEDSSNAGFLTSAGYFDSQDDADIGGYGSSYFQSGNDYKETSNKEEMKKELTTPLFALHNVVASTSCGEEVKNSRLFGDLNEKVTTDHVNSQNFTPNLVDESQPTADDDDSPDLNICETCREVTVSEDKETDDLTTQLIENITAPIQLLNPVVALHTESATANIENSFEADQCSEISQITEKTIETIQVQSATELLDDETGVRNRNVTNYGWNATGDAAFHPPEVLLDHDYNFQIDPNSVGFFGNNSMFFENIPNNASDELKAEFKSTHEETPLYVPRQMSIPSAPPAEDDDTKSDETGGLDVHSIEQDAKKDFPIDDEFVIEPSETDDDKMEYKEMERSSEDPVQDVDSFTNRVEKFKLMEETVTCDDIFSLQKSQLFDMNTAASPAITIASYFDTGNYAADTHYRNSISSPSGLFHIGSPKTPMRIPPGFEEEYKRRMSELAIRNQNNKNDNDDNVPYIPDTSTQTRPVLTTTYSLVSSQPLAVTVTSTMMVTSKPLDVQNTDIMTSHQPVSGTVLNDDAPVPKLPEFSSVFGQKFESGDNLSSSILNKIDKEQLKAEDKIEADKPQPLADPISFFASKDEPPSEPTDNNFNRLASYFSTPAKNDHGKSFFELSQSQNHYRHANNNFTNKNTTSEKRDQDITDKVNLQNIPTDIYIANLALMNDLTASRNISVSPKGQIRTVNYFTLEYDNDTELKSGIGEPDLKNIDKEILNKRDELDDCSLCDDKKIMMVVSKCKYCCNNDGVKLNKLNIGADFKVRKVMDSDNSSPVNSTDITPDMDQKKEDRRKEVTVNFGSPLHEESEVSTANESRVTTEYTPVKHHWFYRVDFEGKSIWRGFSASDNTALEEAFTSPDLDERTLVATDGGRFDVNIVGRLRTAVYWSDKPTNVRRCSWFYKGTTDARYVPYTEPVAEKLEEEYRRGVTTGEWHRRLVLPSSELVVMHGPAVMVHFPHAPDALGTSPLFAFGKRVYRNPPKIRVARDQPEMVDHLILLVHGAGEYRSQKEKEKFSTMRPRVVRRGCDESEIEDTEPSSIDHLLLLCHGVGSACDMRFRSVEEVVDDFRATSLQLLQSHYRNSYEKGIVHRVEVLPISWHATLHSGETGVDRRLAAITLDSIPRLRNFTNDTVLDVLFYTSPVFCQTIIDTVCCELNRTYALFVSRNPHFRGSVSLGGHSLGSVILYDLLCHQPTEGIIGQSAGKTYLEGGAGTGQNTVRYPPLTFRPAALYALGSPIAMFECIRGVKSLGSNFSLPTCKNFFNIFHPYDPIAYRIEPLINSQLGSVKPFLIPHHKGRKRMHLELKETMARVGADLKQKLIESLKSTWSSMWKTQEPAHDAHLEKVIEEETEKEQLCEDSKEETTQNDNPSPELLGSLNSGRRIDYVLQETPFEMINEYLFAMSSHVCYWESEDTMLLILREIYDSLGVAPDCTVPQQTMTVQRTVNEAYVISSTEYPSTSRDGT